MIITGHGSFFWFDPIEPEMHLCETLEEAQREANDLLSNLFGFDEWEADEAEITSIVVGEITNRVVVTRRTMRPANMPINDYCGDDDDRWPGGVVDKVAFALKPVGATQKPDSQTTEDPK